MSVPKLAFLLTGLALAALTALSGAAAAEEPKAPTAVVVDPYVRLLPPGTRHTAAFFRLENHGERELELVGAATELARAELHGHVSEGGVMKMRPVPVIAVPAGGAVTLAPGGLHVMLMDVTRPLAEGELVPLTLRFKDGTTLEVRAPVRPITPAAPKPTP